VANNTEKKDTVKNQKEKKDIVKDQKEKKDILKDLKTGVNSENSDQKVKKA